MQTKGWAVVLAAGLGSRVPFMADLCKDETTPKQYCSCDGGPSFLRLALTRACAIVQHDRVLCVVAAEHEQWWRNELDGIPTENIIVQPLNCGTAAGTLVSLFVARYRETSPQLVFLPADHYVAVESILARSITTAFQALEQHSGGVILLGMEPDNADAELGYIVSARMPRDWNGVSQGWTLPVARFVDKPTTHHAQTLIQGGALWNCNVFAAEADALLALFRERIPQTLAVFESVVGRMPDSQSRMADFYQKLASVDLSRNVFAPAKDRLAVLRVPSCGWTDADFKTSR